MTDKTKAIICVILAVLAILLPIIMLPHVIENKEPSLIDLQIESTKLEIEILKAKLKKGNTGDRVLTLKDLKYIYSCVDTKISNSKHDNEFLFPCVAVDGE